MEASPGHHRAEFQSGSSRLLSAQPDAVLCRLAARGNASAYEALYARYSRPLIAFAFHLLGRAARAEDAEDIVQDTFTRAFAGIREQRVDGSFKPWLYTIARNRTFDTLRARRENVVSLDAELTDQPAAPGAQQPPERAEQRAELAWLLGAVAALPERQREALLLKEIGGVSHAGIADQLGTTVSATKKLISRGRDGIDRAALAGGFRRSGSRLGRELVIAVPVLPLALSLGSLGVTTGAGAGGAAAGKVAATVFAVLALGGGVVAVEQRARSTDGEAAAARTVTAPATLAATPAEIAFGPQGRASGFSGGPDDNADREGRDEDRSSRDDRDDDRADRDDDDDRSDRSDDDGDDDSDDGERDEDDSRRMPVARQRSGGVNRQASRPDAEDVDADDADSEVDQAGEHDD